MLTSLEIAKKFNILHKNVLRSLRNVAIENDLSITESYYNTGYRNCKCKYYVVSEALYKHYREYTKTRISLCLKEIAAIDTIEQVLNVKLERQFKCGKYKIDGYDSINKVAYEIDEQHHRHNIEEDLSREEEIKRYLGCTFKRVKV